MSDQPSNQSNKSLMFWILDIVVKVIFVLSIFLAVVSLIGLLIDSLRGSIYSYLGWALLFGFGTTSSKSQTSLGITEKGEMSTGQADVTEIGYGFFMANFFSYVILALFMAAIKRYVLDRRTE